MKLLILCFASLLVLLNYVQIVRSQKCTVNCLMQCQNKFGRGAQHFCRGDTCHCKPKNAVPCAVNCAMECSEYYDGNERATPVCYDNVCECLPPPEGSAEEPEEVEITVPKKKCAVNCLMKCQNRFGGGAQPFCQGYTCHCKPKNAPSCSVNCVMQCLGDFPEGGATPVCYGNNCQCLPPAGDDDVEEEEDGDDFDEYKRSGKAKPKSKPKKKKPNPKVQTMSGDSPPEPQESGVTRVPMPPKMYAYSRQPPQSRVARVRMRAQMPEYD